MSKRKVIMGNHAVSYGVKLARVQVISAYPITPQSEVAEYLSRRLPEAGGTFLQGESEVAVGYMIFGAAATGERVFTTSSSPGISLMQEGISYEAAYKVNDVIGGLYHVQVMFNHHNRILFVHQPV